ncbi:hypothetical protein M407DRAFT_12860 [Tulasnella calospora MUT 4182]|uniref:Uncharacterized protein n=1 Tax=Tulasnella calospora MUT 4182 TaxID=1051891 RepID=A0A0C3Q1E7_9AGAM|nr:hypothetical protein M407DRAFT_12860 [Tulasnella calospora MUT 4182]
MSDIISHPKILLNNRHHSTVYSKDACPGKEGPPTPPSSLSIAKAFIVIAGFRYQILGWASRCNNQMATDDHEAPFILPQDVPPPLRDTVESLSRVIENASQLRRNTQKIMHLIARCIDIIEDLKSSINAQPSTVEEMIRVVRSVPRLGILLAKFDCAVNKEVSSPVLLSNDMIETWESSRNEFQKLLNEAYQPEFRDVEQVARIDDHLWARFIAQDIRGRGNHSEKARRVDDIASKILTEQKQVTRNEDIQTAISLWHDTTMDPSPPYILDNDGPLNPLSASGNLDHENARISPQSSSAMSHSTQADGAIIQSLVQSETPPYPPSEPLPGILTLGPRTIVGNHSDVYKGIWTHNGEEKAVCIKCLRNNAPPTDPSCLNLTPEERFKRGRTHEVEHF